MENGRAMIYFSFERSGCASHTLCAHRSPRIPPGLQFAYGIASFCHAQGRSLSTAAHKSVPSLFLRTPMSIPNNQAIIDDNPFAAPTTELAAEKFKRLPQAKLAAIAHGLQALNWTFIVACLMLAVCYGVPHSYLSGYIVGGLTSLAVGLLACVVLAMLFLVYPIAGSLLGAFSLFIPFTWPVTLYAINARARQLLVRHGMSVGVFGQAHYVAQMADEPNQAPNQFDMGFERVITMGFIGIGVFLVGLCFFL